MAGAFAATAGGLAGANYPGAVCFLSGHLLAAQTWTSVGKFYRRLLKIYYHLGENFLPPSSPLARQFYYLLVLLPLALAISHTLQRAYQRLLKP
ncbi:MAG: hypothetical protein ABIT76_11420 [Chthoniobacterales bacterium]